MFHFFLGIVTLFCGIQVIALEPVLAQESVEEIDAEIDRLTDLSNRYKSAAARHENDAMRWQFTQEYKQDAKRAFVQADKERALAKKLDEQINALELHKAELLKRGS